MTDNDERVRVDVGALRTFCAQVFRKLGIAGEDAEIAADVICTADLRGIDSHGVARLRSLYINRFPTGMILPRAELRVITETPATAVLDGGGGLGHPTAHRAMTLAIEKALKVGAGFVSVRNGNHFGIAGYYAMMALKHDCIGLTMTNTNRWLVPTFGRDAMLGTNPIAVAVPAGKERPFVLDMATTISSMGKLEVRDQLGKSIPLGWATDERGIPSTEPGPVLRNVWKAIGGGLLPLGGAGEEMGGHKGYGLAVWVDIFSALLSGALYADQVYTNEPGGKPRVAHPGHFFGAWRVDAFRPPDEFHAAMDDLLVRLKGSRKAEGETRIYVAGEKEFDETERRLRDGIPLPPVVVADLQALGRELDVAPLPAGHRPAGR